MDEKLLLEQIDAFVAENRENVLRDLKTLVDINSVEGQPQPGAPFGPGPRKALEAALDIAAGMGLDAHNCEGYIGYADLPGASPTQIATITHLDVVPEGNGWTGSPFDMVRRDGYVVGRGVADDKGPAVLTLYAAKFFKQQGATLPLYAAHPAGRQRGDRHERRGLLPGTLSPARILLHAGRRVPGVLRGKGRLRRLAGERTAARQPHRLSGRRGPQCGAGPCLCTGYARTPPR